MIATLIRLGLLCSSLAIFLIIYYGFTHFQEGKLTSPALLMLLGSMGVYGYGAVTFMVQKGINPLDTPEGIKTNE